MNEQIRTYDGSHLPPPSTRASRSRADDHRIKVYKARLKQAGLLKNITLKNPQDVEAALHLLTYGQTGQHSRLSIATGTAVRLANGHVVSLDRLAEHLRRKHVLARTAQPGECTSCAPSPWTSHLDAPGNWRIAEQIFAKSWEYKSRRLSFDHLQELRCETVTYATWFDTVMNSRDLLQQGDFKNAVALLRLAPMQLRDMLQVEPPGTLDLILGPIFTVMAAPQSADVQTQMVVKSLVRYLAQVSTEIDGLSLELRAIFTLLSQVSTEDGSALYETALGARKCILDLESVTCKSWEAHADGQCLNMMCTDTIMALDSSKLEESMQVAHKWCRLGAVVGYNHLPAGLEASLQAEYEKAAARFGKTSREASLPLCVLAQLYGQRSVVMQSMKDTNRAQEALWVLLDNATADATRYTTKERLCTQRDLYWGVSGTYFLQGNSELAEEYMRKAISAGVTVDGELSESVFRLRIQLRGFFMRFGNDAGVVEMEGRRQEYLAHLQEQVRASKNDTRAEARYVTALHATWPSATMFRQIGMGP